ncbi:MAG: hypothetical protein JZU64_09550 [Rhodoferax sp.]|jgi:hypothetical protein|nr:hypothetical protein [Rhodoferax sp.]
MGPDVLLADEIQQALDQAMLGVVGSGDEVHGVDLEVEANRNFRAGPKSVRWRTLA